VERGDRERARDLRSDRGEPDRRRVSKAWTTLATRSRRARAVGPRSVGRMTDPIALVEAAYANAATEADWLEGLPRACATILPSGRGLFAFAYDSRDPDWVAIGSASAVGIDPNLMQALLHVPVERGEATRAMVRIFRSMLVTTAQKELPRTPQPMQAQ